MPREDSSVKRTYSEPTENTSVFHADCLDFLTSYSGKPFDLVYLDPPFFLEREFKYDARSDQRKFQGAWTDSDFRHAVQDMVGTQAPANLVNYLSWLLTRLEAIKSKMSETASIFLHIGTREAPYVSMLLDHVFGFSNWRSTITWQRSHPHNNMTKSIGNVSDFIYYYSMSKSYKFNLQYTAHDAKYLANSFRNKDEKGNYALAPIIQERSRNGHDYEHKGVRPPYGWRVKHSDLLKLDSEGYIHWGSNRPYKKVYLSETHGALLQNVWTDIHNITRTEIDKRHYPTQKPIALLERIVALATDEGDLVYDPFCGSGTTLVAAKRLSRNYLGTDISLDAIKTTEQRLQIALGEVIEDRLF